MRRQEIKDEDWERLRDMLPGRPSDSGVTAKDNPLLVVTNHRVAANVGSHWEIQGKSLCRNPTNLGS